MLVVERQVQVELDPRMSAFEGDVKFWGLQKGWNFEWGLVCPVPFGRASLASLYGAGFGFACLKTFLFI
jgi:hypothetical protein